MANKPETIYNELIEACDSYLAVPSVINPGDYYGRIREIQDKARRAATNDGETLATLQTEVMALRSNLSVAQRDAFDKHHANAHKIKLEGK